MTWKRERSSGLTVRNAAYVQTGRTHTCVSAHAHAASHAHNSVGHALWTHQQPLEPSLEAHGLARIARRGDDADVQASLEERDDFADHGVVALKMRAVLIQRAVRVEGDEAQRGRAAAHLRHVQHVAHLACVGGNADGGRRVSAAHTRATLRRCSNKCACVRASAKLGAT